MPETEKRKQYKKDWFNNKSDQWKKEFKEKYKRNYEDNKIELQAQSNQRIICECGAKIREGYKYRHKKTKKHQNYLLPS